MTGYLVAAIKPWNVDAFQRHTPSFPGEWSLVDDPADLTLELIERLQPRYVFFPHWSWKVPPEILSAVECVCFHMTDVPYGRGGSPLQNLILNGHNATMLSALRMVDEMDAGPVYAKTGLDLSGRAQEIYERAANLIYELIGDIVAREPEPVTQAGDVVVFSRRSPEQSLLPTKGTLEALFDHIRMLDAETYPRAFLRYGDFQLEFDHAELAGDRITARVLIRPANTEKDRK